jgi:hypothetical protein
MFFLSSHRFVSLLRSIKDKMKYSVVGLLLMVLVCISGCSGEKRPDGLPTLYPAASIKVVQDGQPLEDAIVSLRPDDKSMKWGVGGRTNAQGVAQLWTHGKYKGAPAGTFKVIVTKNVNAGEKEYLEAMNRNDTNAAEAIKVQSFSCVEDKFGTESQTPLTVEITSSSKTLEVNAGPAVKIEKPYLR